MLSVDDLVKSFSDDQRGRASKKEGAAKGPSRVRAVDGISISVEEGEFFTLLGPSGCGKTTTLRSVAGLEDPDTGRIQVGERVLFEAGAGKGRTNVPANKRGLGMVFQSYAIWPHMTVFENAAFPLRVAGGDRKDIRPRVMRVLETMELAHLAERRATKLSGGQQQRLALGRAIVTEPPLLLLDEPLSNLDAKLRESLRFEIKRLQNELGITTLYVTHDQSEALAMSTQIAVMHAGRIVQLGTPREIYESPNSIFVAEFIGASNLVPGTVTAIGGGRVEVDTAIGRFVSSRPIDSGAAAVGESVRVSIRPETVRLSSHEDAAAGGVNRVSGTVVATSYVGDSVITVVRAGSTELRVRSAPTLNPEAGSEVALTVTDDSVTVLTETH
jgi:iron(III) transport system ATP-binding protein